MSHIWKRMLPLLLLPMVAVLLTLSAAAVEPTYEFSEPYRASEYDDALLACELTGDMRYDVLSVAFSQLGYHEGDSDAEMDGGNAEGAHNFVEYNRLYGKLDNGEGNGMSYGYAWCAAFVSWCLRQSGVPEEVAVTEVSCRRMTAWYREQAGYHAQKSGYLPLPGDIIMFHEGDGVAVHVGLVIGVERGRVYVIDGNNRENAVATHVYHRNDPKILGYCVPDYVTREGTVYDFPLEPRLSDGHVATVAVVTGGVLLVATAVLVPGIVRLRRRKEIVSSGEGEDE